MNILSQVLEFTAPSNSFQTVTAHWQGTGHPRWRRDKDVFMLLMSEAYCVP